MRTAPSHFAGIDALRFLAATVVVLFHLLFWNWVYPGVAFGYNGGLIVFPNLIQWVYWGWVGVQVFFVISGFVIALTAQHASPYGFLVSRVARLGPGVWICAPITFAALQLVHVSSRREALSGLVHSVFFYPFEPWVDGVYWTLGIELVFYSVIFALLVIRRFDWIKRVAATIGLISTVFWLAYAGVEGFARTELRDVFGMLMHARALDLLLVHHGCEFALGVFIWLHFAQRKSCSQAAFMLVFAAAGCINIYAENDFQNGRLLMSCSWLLPEFVWLAAVGFMVCSVARDSVRCSPASGMTRALRRMGLMSYPLYLVHHVLGGVLMVALVRLGFHKVAAFAAVFAFVLILSLYESERLEPPLRLLTRRALFGIRDRVTARLAGTPN